MKSSEGAREGGGQRATGTSREAGAPREGGAPNGAGGPREDRAPKRLTVAAHPRAVRGIKRAKSLCGLFGFLLGGYLSLPTHTLADAGLRALIAGAACYVIAWAGALFLWRGLIVTELRNREHQLLAAELARMQVPVSASNVRVAAGRAGAGDTPPRAGAAS
jgi:hypothetical protein